MGSCNRLRELSEAIAELITKPVTKRIGFSSPDGIVLAKRVGMSLRSIGIRDVGRESTIDVTGLNKDLDKLFGMLKSSGVRFVELEPARHDSTRMPKDLNPRVKWDTFAKSGRATTI